MRKSRFGDEKMLTIAAKSRTATIAEMPWCHGINKNTLIRWRVKC